MVETENQDGEMEVFDLHFWLSPCSNIFFVQVLPIAKKRSGIIFIPTNELPRTILFSGPVRCKATCIAIQRTEPSSQTFATTYSEMNTHANPVTVPGAGTSNSPVPERTGKACPGFGQQYDLDVLPVADSCIRGTMRVLLSFGGADMQVPTYHVDGQIDDEVYVYGSYVQSKMFHKGVKCVDCHDPHTVRVHAPNCACVATRQRPKIRILPPITFINPEAKELSAWNVICRKTYMGIDARRDHSIIPRPDLSVKFGMPNL